MERVGVLHCKLSYSDEACPWSWIVPPLCLYLINHYRESLIGVDFTSGTVGDCLFIGHGKNHVSSVSILESAHLLINGVPASCFLPDIRRVYYAHKDLLSTDPIHFFTDNGFDLLGRSHAQRQHGKDTGAKLADESGSKKVFISLAVCTVWCFTQGFCKHFRHSHRSVSPCAIIKN